MEIVWKCFPALSSRSLGGGEGCPTLAGPGGVPRAPGGQRGSGHAPREEIGAGGGTAVPWGSTGRHGAGGSSPGIQWSITSSRRLSAIPTALRAPPGTARSEVDTLGSEEADTSLKRGGTLSGDPRDLGPLVSRRSRHLWHREEGGEPGGCRTLRGWWACGGTLVALLGAEPGNKEVNRPDSPLVLITPAG